MRHFPGESDKKKKKILIEVSRNLIPGHPEYEAGCYALSTPQEKFEA
jgi:hypothetical protein